MTLLLTLLLAFLFVTPVYAHTIDDAGKTVMHMNDNGYEPKDITITVGDTIVFENASLEDKWPASNIHPTHAIYPEFDQQRPVPPGESWSFTFSKVGVWKYHDHLTPTMIGTITVEGETDNSGDAENADTPARQSIWASFKTFFLNMWHRLFGLTTESEESGVLPAVAEDSAEIFTDTTLLKSYVQTFGPQKTIRRLHDLQATHGDCHQIAHEAGRSAYEIFGVEAFKTCSAECHSGCYHGATEAFFKEKGTADLTKNISVICNADANNFMSHQCFHGIGHGLMAWSSYELLESLTACDQLTEGRESCYSGVFMENVVGGLAKDDFEARTSTTNTVFDAHFTKYLSDDPQYPCNAVEDKYKSACYFFQTSRMMQVFDNKFDMIAAECARAPKAYQQLCFQSLGRDIAPHYPKNPSGIITQCSFAARGEDRTGCFIGAINDIIWDPLAMDDALTFCNALPNADEQAECYQALFIRVPQLLTQNDDLAAFCARIPDAYQAECPQRVQ